MKNQEIWVLNCGDTGCDEDGYVAVAKLFARKSEAVNSMRSSVAEDEWCFNTDAKWSSYHNGRMAVIDCSSVRKIVYTLDKVEVN